MTKQKKGSPKQRKKKKPQRPKQKHPALKILAGAAMLIAVVVVPAMVIHYFVFGKRLSPAPTTAPAVYKVPSFEIYPKEEIPKKPFQKPKHPKKKITPEIAIIIDDIGYHRKLAEKLILLDKNLTFSVLPISPHRAEILRFAEREGAETMLHLPMEPDEYPRANPGPGALLMSMSPDELIRQLEKNLDKVPTVKGVNNHMGSKMTAISTQMYQIFTILKKRNLFFIDSRTSAESLCRPSARLLKLPFAQRDIFLDHFQTAEFVKKQLDKLVRIAMITGEAIGIGHPYPVTYRVLLEELPKIRKSVKLVPASQLVEIPG